MEIPETLRYAASHEWVSDAADGIVSVGISAVATDQLGELVYVELPQPGATVKRGDACAVVESTKAASDVYAPVSGEVLEVNARLSEEPQQVNASPYGEGWLMRIRLADASEFAQLLDAAAYRAAAGTK